jgi:hypothetical protein
MKDYKKAIENKLAELYKKQSRSNRKADAAYERGSDKVGDMYARDAEGLERTIRHLKGILND